MQPLNTSLWPMTVLGYIKPTSMVWAHLLTSVLLVPNQGLTTGVSSKVVETQPAVHPDSDNAGNPLALSPRTVDPSAKEVCDLEQWVTAFGSRRTPSLHRDNAQITSAWASPGAAGALLRWH